MIPHKILLIEDDAAFGKMLHGWFLRNGYEPVLCINLAHARDAFKSDDYSLVLTDLRLPDGEGTEVLSWTTNREGKPPVIIMTSYGEIQSAVGAIKKGAFDFLEKPINPSILKEKVSQAIGSNYQDSPVTSIVQETPPRKTAKDNLQKEIVYGSSPASIKMHDHIKIVAPTKMSVLLLGESGTGKEYAAKLIHQQSDRSDKVFIAVDCGSLSKELAPSELFGHVKGSFTSAIADKKGVFEQADGGTVFLDEVGNLSYDVQVQLLRALQEKKIRPVGSATDIVTDVRIIAATNEDLRSAVESGRFREDLFHRLNELPIVIPPLRERLSDLMLFANHFLQEANSELGKQLKGFDKKAESKLLSRKWTGNLRELRNCIRRAALFSDGDFISDQHLPEGTLNTTNNTELTSLKPKNEKELIEQALRQASGNKSTAAKLLGIDRKTLYNKMHLYNIEL